MRAATELRRCPAREHLLRDMHVGGRGDYLQESSGDCVYRGKKRWKCRQKRREGGRQGFGALKDDGVGGAEIKKCYGFVRLHLRYFFL